MIDNAYDTGFKVQRRHWFLCVRREIIGAVLGARMKHGNNPPRILDIGCGPCAMLNDLQKYGTVEGMDFSQRALDYCRKIFDGPLRQCDLNDPITFDHTYEAVIATDVLEHVKDDYQGIRNIVNALSPGGCAIITVPAHPFMWSTMDECDMHQRRYTKKSFRALLDSSGLDIEYLSWWNCWLYPPIVVARLLERLLVRKTDKLPPIELSLPPKWLNRLLYHIYHSELRPIVSGRHLPWGVSLFAVLRKPA